MANPGRVLHVMFTTLYKRVEFGIPPGLDPTLEEARQVGLTAQVLVRVDELLAQMAEDQIDVARYQQRWIGWSAALGSYLSFDSSPTDFITKELLEEVEELADFFDEWLWEIDAQSAISLKETLRSARDALEADTSLSQELRSYVSRLLGEIESALNDVRAGSVFDYGEAITQLFVALKAAEGERTPSHEIWRMLWTQTASAVAANGLWQGLIYGAPIIFKAITS